MKLQLVLLAVLLALASSVTFNVQVTSTCTNITTGICTAWNQTGSIVEDTGTCFPASTLVRTPEGDVTIDKLRIGQRVLAFNPITGKTEFSPVVAWLHREPETVSKYVKISTKDSTLTASALHNIAVGEETKYKFAYAQETLGRKLTSGQIVESVEETTDLGVYAPLTGVSNFYVVNGGVPTLVHSYAHIRNPEYYESIISTMLSGYNYVFGQATESETGKYIHPLAKALAAVFKNILLEGYLH